MTKKKPICIGCVNYPNLPWLLSEGRGLDWNLHQVASLDHNLHQVPSKIARRVQCRRRVRRRKKRRVRRRNKNIVKPSNVTCSGYTKACRSWRCVISRATASPIRLGTHIESLLRHATWL